jgi:hypothetical protein
MFHLSGTINVLLFLIIRPELLLFPRPRQLDEQEIELTQEDAGPAILSDTARFRHSPEPTLAFKSLGGESSRDSGTASHNGSRRVSVDIEQDERGSQAVTFFFIYSPYSAIKRTVDTYIIFILIE